ncbi:MAG: hypothetical protein ACI837_000472 [Crocinitomicaceae bacterium]|jgi:hypothetical protein
MKLVVALLFISFLGTSFGQKVTKATSQTWAGGVCCSWGTNYAVEIKLKKPTDEMKIVEVWLNGGGKLIGSIYKNPTAKSLYTVTFELSQNYNPYDGSDEIDKLLIEEIKEVDLITAPKYIGAALLVLELNGKRKELEIDSFEALQMIAYP